MSVDNWKKVIKRYAEGKTPCNCGNSYYDSEGNCPSGCSANCKNAKEYIAKKILGVKTSPEGWGENES